jgi:hypothetical protein
MSDITGSSDLLPEQPTPAAAAARIAELKADPKFTEKYLTGETGAREEFTRLHAVVGKGPVNEIGQHRASQLDALKKHADLPPQCWDQIANNGPVFEHERAEALQMKERCMRDRGWVSRYLDGSREEVSLMTRISLILASPVKKEGS